MPKFRNTIPGEWRIGETWIKTGDKVASLSDSLLEVNIFQDVYKPFETCVFIISNDAGVDSLLPIIVGTSFYFSYVLSGIKFERFYKVVALEYVTTETKSRGIKLTGVTREYYNAALKKESIAYKDFTTEKMLAMNGITDLFVSDKIEARTWIIPHGKNRIEFINSALTYSVSPILRMKSRLIRSKEGYSVCTFESFTDSMKELYELDQEKSISLYYKTDKLKRIVKHEDTGDQIPLEKIMAVDEYFIKNGRSIERSNNHKEFSYLIDTFDPMRKLYEVFKYEQVINTEYSSVLYSADDIVKTPARYYETDSSSTVEKDTKKYQALQNGYALNRSGFSSQNSITVEMNSSALCEVGLKYDIEIGADVPGEMNQYVDPVLSGTKYCVQARHTFVPEKLARCVLTLASEGGIPTKAYHNEANLGKK